MTFGVTNGTTCQHQLQVSRTRRDERGPEICRGARLGGKKECYLEESLVSIRYMPVSHKVVA
jgi:hypothetical protein